MNQFDVFVAADLRWAVGTGIGAVQRALLARAPTDIKIYDLGLRARIGSPLTPVLLSSALRKRRGEDNVFWSPGYMPPLSSEIPVVVTVHDLTHLRYYSKAHAAYYDVLLKRIYRHCDAIICVSDFTRAEFISWSGVAKERVWTIKNGISDVFTLESATKRFTWPYVLYPGNRRSYKNLDRLLQAYAASCLWRDGIRLVLTGAEDYNLRKVAKRLGVSSHLQFSGVLNESELAAWYRGALLVTFVSLYEGFGLPIVEAMAVGVPVLTSNVSAMPETAGGAALLVDPTSVDEISGGMRALAYDEALRARLISRGKNRVKAFSWEKSAGEVWKIIRTIRSYD